MAADDEGCLRTDRKDTALTEAMPHPPAVAAVSMDVQIGNTGFIEKGVLPAAAADTLRQFGDKQPNILQRRQPNSTQQQQQKQPTMEEKDRQREQRIHRMKLLLEQCEKSDYSEYKKRLSNMTADERNDEAKALEMRQRQLLNQEALELKRMMALNMSVGSSQVKKSSSWSLYKTLPRSSYQTP